MGQIQITVSASVTLDGGAVSNSGTVTLPCTNYTHQTRDFVDGFEQVAASNIGSGYLVVVNTGEESLFVQLASTGPDYIVFEVVAGGHGVYPMTIDDGAAFSIGAVNVRSATSAGCRGIIITAQV